MDESGDVSMCSGMMGGLLVDDAPVEVCVWDMASVICVDDGVGECLD